MANSKSGAKPRDESPTDAIELLKADHKRVKALFKRFAALRQKRGDTDEKSEVVQSICRELKVHTTIEEEIFYPAVRAKIDDGDLMDEALVEHASAKDLVEQLEGMDADDDLYDAKVTVLGEQIDHHVQEEEGEMFPRAAKAAVDTKALGAEMRQRKVEVLEALDEEGAPKGGSKPAPRASQVTR
jgi:hemerythrin superfamily protein